MSPLHVKDATCPTGPAAPRGRFAFRVLATLCLVAALAMFAISSWIPIKAQIAQVLLERAFAQSLANGKPAKPWSWADTWPVARISIPRLGTSAIVLNGATSEALAFGPAHLNETPSPGNRGTSVIAAHRDTHFRFLQHVKVGDEIRVKRSDGAGFRYRVTNLRVADWNRTGIDAHSPGYNLVLSTCYPFDSIVSGTERYIVEATRIKQTAGSDLQATSRF